MKRGVEAVMTSLAAKDGMGERVPLVRMKRYGAALRISRATETLGSMHHRLRVRPGGGGGLSLRGQSSKRLRPVGGWAPVWGAPIRWRVLRCWDHFGVEI